MEKSKQKSMLKQKIACAMTIYSVMVVMAGFTMQLVALNNSKTEYETKNETAQSFENQTLSVSGLNLSISGAIVGLVAVAMTDSKKDKVKSEDEKVL